MLAVSKNRRDDAMLSKFRGGRVLSRVWDATAAVGAVFASVLGYGLPVDHPLVGVAAPRGC